MSDALTLLFGPLAAPECARASRRGWLIWVRLLPAVASGAMVFLVIWFWWMNQQINPTYQPFTHLRVALTAIDGLMIAFALIMTPAMLAGSLAGEKERGSIGLLLTTRASAADIVLGRLTGRLSQVAMIELAALPALLLVASLVGMGWGQTLTLIALTSAIGFGGAGIALGASAMSRRGRDSLLFVYLLEVLFLLSPLLRGLGVPWVGVMSPFETFASLTNGGEPGPSLVTAGAWTAMGVVGLVLASWRLRPSCLAEGDDARSRKRAKRLGYVPPVDEKRPMLWKELHIERVGTLGRAGRWIGGLLVLWLALGSLVLGGVVGWGFFKPVRSDWTDWAISLSSTMYGNSAVVIGWLIQWGIGLRAAVTISSERERGTWDALLTSPLQGAEIVRGKLWGSLWALKWLIGSALLAWTITFAIGGMFWPEYTEHVVGLAVVGTFMSAIGVRTSLMSSTATKSMGITIGFWCAACVLAIAIAWFACLLVLVVCVIGWLYAVSIGLTTMNSAPWFPMTFRLGTDLMFYGQFVVAAILVVAETRTRFDRVAGRMTGGATSIAIDRIIHGVPMAPVYLGKGKGKEKVAEPELDGFTG